MKELIYKPFQIMKLFQFTAIVIINCIILQHKTYYAINS